ncbi:protein vein [Eupeodes corollae]|uniref:protein vein n=1 Tax=Eupeodes corollae TaxID=290404 RepID=UPI00249030FD|nr:protein vein [Eupeodes corollae]
MYARELRKWSLKYHMSYLWLSAIVTMLLLIIYCPNATTMHLPINTKTRDPALRIPAIPTDSTGYNWWLMMDRLSSSTSSSSPSNSNRQQFQFNSNIDSSSNLSSSIISNKNNNILNTNSYKNNNNNNNNHPLAVFSDLRNHNARARAPVNEATAAVAAATDSIHNNHIKNHNVPNANSQINFNSYASNSLTKNAYDFSSRNSRRSNKLRRHTNTQPNANYHSPVRVGSKSVPLPLPESFTTTDSQTQTQIPISHSLSPSPSQSPVVPYTLLPHHSTVQRYAITAYHVPPESSPPAVMEFDQHRRRRLLLRQQARNRTMMLAARSRRDSATSGVPLGYLRSAPIGSYSNYNNKHKKHHHNRNNNNNNGNSNNNNNNNYHHNNNRKRPRRYCSARDPAQLAFEAPTVFEGKIISMTRDRRANFSATVEVKEVFKKQIGFRLQKYLRLKFAYRNSSAECDIYREFLRPRGLVRGDELEQGRIYVMFVRQIDSSNFTILGQPIRKTQHVIQAVKKAVSDKYAQLASIKSITASNQTVENGKELRIVCKVQGQPPPKVTWFKDHKSINRNRRLYQFIHYKRRSELIIRSFNSSDAGTYECRAKNKVNQNLEKRSLVIKAYPMPRYNTPTQLSGGKCPEDAYEFCFNGGTCMFFKEIGSYSCVCPEGFIGERCDRKEVNNMPPIPRTQFNADGFMADDPNSFDDDIASNDSDEINEDDNEDNHEDEDEDDDFYNPLSNDQFFFNKLT